MWLYRNHDVEDDPSVSQDLRQLHRLTNGLDPGEGLRRHVIEPLDDFIDSFDLVNDRLPPKLWNGSWAPKKKR
jgi:hypothetical protein